MTQVHHPYIKVGEGTKFVDSPTITASKNSTVKIGKYCAIGRGFKILTINHDYNFPAIQGTFYRDFFKQAHPGEMLSPPNPERTKGHVVVGNDVWFGEDVTVLSGVTIGDGCCIGARSVVTKDLKPYSICAGVPCKIIKPRYNQEMIDFLLKLEWWNWPFRMKSQNKEFFNTNLNKTPLEKVRKMIRTEFGLLIPCNSYQLYFESQDQLSK